MIETKGYRKLKVYTESHRLVIMIYRATDKFPRSEIFGLISQMRRSAVSVVANIVEGHARSTREFKQFLVVAQGSLVELEYYLDLSLELEYLNRVEYEKICAQRLSVGSMLGGLLKSINKKLVS